MYILFEGVDGVGKSTQLEIFSKTQPQTIITKEPGGSALGERLREILLGDELKPSKRAEIFLFLADRAEHYERVLRAHEGELILADRGFISGVAYASLAEIFSLDQLLNLNKMVLNGLLPDGVVLFIADEATLKSRLASRTQTDRIEAQGIAKLIQIQNKMQECIKALKLPHIVIDAGNSVQEISQKISKFIKEINDSDS